MNRRFPYKRFTENRSIADAERLFAQRIADALSIYDKHGASFASRRCPVCGSAQHRDLEKFHGVYGVVRCAMCTTMFVNPAPTLDALKDYYNTCESNLMMARIYRNRAQQPTDFVGDFRVAEVLRRLSLAPRGDTVRVLEIGCSSGSFLSKLRLAARSQVPALLDLELVGIDIDGNAIAANADAELTLLQSSAEEFTASMPDPFDFVLCFELVEHLIDPLGFMQSVRRLLKTNGIVVLTTPNAGGLETMACGYNSRRLLAHSIFPPMHLNAFSVENVVHFVLRSGLAVIEIQTPGALDVDIIAESRGALTSECFRAIADLDEDAKGLIQQLARECRVSSHMLCILGKPTAGDTDGALGEIGTGS